jgi:hypothetical protein
MYVPLYYARRFQYQENILWNGGAEIAQLGYALDDRGVRILAGARYLPFFQNVHTSSRAQPASYWMGTEGFYPWWLSGRSVRLITHLHLVPTLRMNRTVPLHPLYALMACIGDDFTFFTCSMQKCLSLRGRLGRDVRIQNCLLNLKNKCIFARLLSCFSHTWFHPLVFLPRGQDCFCYCN